jgi:SNF2 family DNA or RNA helicase
LITTYEMAVSDAARLNKIPWKVMIVDEAHRLKNEACILVGSSAF